MQKKKQWPLQIEEAFDLMDAAWEPQKIYEHGAVISKYLQRRKDPMMKARYDMAVFRHYLISPDYKTIPALLEQLGQSNLLGKDLNLKGQYYLNNSLYRYLEKDAANALKFAEKALEVFRQSGNRKWQGLTLTHIFTIFQTFDIKVNYEPIELLMELIDICDEAGLADEVITYLYGAACPNVAILYLTEEKYAEALAFLETPYRKLMEVDSPYAFNIRMLMGSARHFQKEYRKALDIFDELYKHSHIKTVHSANLYLTGTLLSSALALKVLPDYMEHYQAYLALVKRVNLPYETLKMLCIVAEKEAIENNAAAAMAALADARELLGTYKLTEHYTALYYDAEWRVHEHLGDYKAGWEAYRKYHEYHLKSTSSITDKKMEILRYKIETANKARENELLKAELERNELELEMAATFLRKKNAILDDMLSFTNVLSKKHKSQNVLFEIKRKLIGYKDDDTERDRINGLVNKNNQEYIKKITGLYPAITNTEAKISTLIKTGLGNKEIASLMATSPRTVETHRSNLRRKLGLATADNLERFLRGI